MKQMPLFSAEHEAERTLREDYDSLCAYYRDLEARLATARVEYRKLREDRDRLATLSRLLQERDQDLSMELYTVRQERDRAQHNARYWQAKYDIEHRVRGLEARDREPLPRTPTLEPTLKKLLFVAHPDRWAQGQDASQLAHELAVVINDLRAEVQ
jgi:chromosome segregation ATPase